MSDARTYWDSRHGSTDATEVSWFEVEPTTSIELIERVRPGRPAAVLDAGAGAGRLVDTLVAGGDEVTVLDVSPTALDLARTRLADPGSVGWVCSDVRSWEPDRRFDVWHDRAMLHFLTEARDRERYLATLRRALRPGGGVVLGVFAEDGPTQCSGLAVHRYAADDLLALLPDLGVVEERHATHITPAGGEQRFRWVAGRLP